MAKIQQWVKANLTIVICGSLALVSIVLLLLGMFLPTAQADLAADKSVYDGLQGIPGKAANERVIEELRRKQAEVNRSVQAFLAAAAKTTPRTLLHPDVFPEPKERFDATEFKDECDRKRLALLALLNAKDEPGQAEIDDFREQILRAKQRQMLQEGETPAASTNLLPMPGGVRSPAAPGGRFGFSAGFGPAAAGGFPGAAAQIPDGMSPEEWVKEDPHAGASVKRAREIYCYAKDESLDPRSLITDRYPSPEIMWEAQCSLWIQEDILQALARLNTEVANQLPEQDRWVGNLPVKRLVYFITGSPLKASSGGDVGTSGRSMGISHSQAKSVLDPVPPSSSLFTNRQAGENLDVIPLTIGLVIDSNYLLRVLDEISKIGFYTTLSVSYEAIPYDPTLRGYIYGPAPVIGVRLEVEHCILRDALTIGDKKYVDLMPESIKTGTWVSPTVGGPAGGSIGGDRGFGPGFSPRGYGPDGPRRGRFGPGDN
ncbi:MAG TPA: hypothetical protein PLS23_00935 [Phycisphaerae bacterium]|nr:hypothetical protein [Phycisphaerae bacterium]